MVKDNIIVKILTNPLVSIMAMIGGGITGYFYHDFAISLEPVGSIFMLLLKMCVIPILVTAIIFSFGRLVGTKEKSISGLRVLFYFFFSFIVIGIISFLLVHFLNPGILSLEKQKMLGGIIQYSQEHQIEDINTEYRSFIDIMHAFIPENIFHALAMGESLQILLLSILIGIASGLLQRKEGDAIINLASSFFNIFVKILNWIMYLLPFGLFALLASQVANTGIEVLLAMVKFVECIYLISIIIITINGILISLKTKMSFFRTFIALKSPLLISFGTRSTFASMPVSINALTKMKITPKIVNLIIPLGSIIARYSMFIIYISAAMFAKQLYHVDFSVLQFFQMFGLSFLISIAGAGTPAIVSLTMISIIFTPLNIPYSSIVILVLAIIPIIDPILTMANVHSNCLVTILLDKPIGMRRKSN